MIFDISPNWKGVPGKVAKTAQGFFYKIYRSNEWPRENRVQEFYGSGYLLLFLISSENPGQIFTGAIGLVEKTSGGVETFIGKIVFQTTAPALRN